jgi:hypothetical protein
VGLVVAPAALDTKGAVLNSNVKALQDTLASLLTSSSSSPSASSAPSRSSPGGERPRVDDFSTFAQKILDWEDGDLVAYDDGDEGHRRALSFPLVDFSETLRPSFAVPLPDDARKEGGSERKWLALVKVIPAGRDFDDAHAYDDRRWQASAQARFERLLWETQIPIGILYNGADLRLCYVPRGESAGHLSFPLDAMVEVPNRAMLSALSLLLGAERLFTLPTSLRLPALLEESRKYQSVVSTQLAGQVLAALHELVAGFQAANVASGHRLLGGVLADDRQQVYGGLLSTLLRLVFVLYAEDRDLLPDDPVYRDGYSVSQLFERLREDAALHPDTMDQRFGAWGQLLGLFRLIFDGAAYKDPERDRLVKLPPRQGKLFNPDTYAFLEGRPWLDRRVTGKRVTPPAVSDGVVLRVLENLMLLDGQRLSYRSLDVEQIGSVYEALMGFALEIAEGTSVAVKPDHVVINLQALLAEKPAQRAKWLKERAGLDVKDGDGLKAAATIDDVTSALGNAISARSAGAGLIPLGAIYLQPTEERRRSGSHYTPRALTEPIVRTALRPHFERFEADGKKTTPQEILELKICDPAMGSGAFLVEVVRQLADALVQAWANHPDDPTVPYDLPPDETQALRAARLVAQRCIYGVDKNPFAVELGKLSLWLATFAKDHPFTFVDHSLKHGDSLVGLSRAQIARFSWNDDAQITFVSQFIEDYLKEAEIDRRTIQRLGDTKDNQEKTLLLESVDTALDVARTVGDLVVAAFFSEDKDRAREEARKRFEDLAQLWLTAKNPDRGRVDEIVAELRQGERGIPPFHWEIEFPEVFTRKNAGFDVFVGNPPFAGKNTIINGNRPAVLDWLKTIHEGAHGNADLVAHFYRRAFSLLRQQGTFGLIATNTIAQGDTRSTGLSYVCTHGGTIYAATRRLKWPGVAAVIVSVVHVAKGEALVTPVLDGREVSRITAFLFHGGGHESPAQLAANAGKSFQGSIVLGDGFFFDDTKADATKKSEMKSILAANSRCAEVIFPYLGGQEFNQNVKPTIERYVISFGELGLEDIRTKWPELVEIVERKVRGRRASHSTAEWWQHERRRPELYSGCRSLERVLAISCGATAHASFSFLPSNMIFANTLAILLLETNACFAAVQCRLHEFWARFFGSSMKDDLRYTPSDCFETFPFPERWEDDPTLEDIGQRYHDFRAALMVKNNEGLTKTYNRFHDPTERDPEIQQLRALHDEMDRAVLDAYGWSDLRPICEFLLDYEDDDDDGTSKRKKPWRYRWPDDVRDEVLARLLELNKARAEAERLLGAEADLEAKTKAPKKKTAKKSSTKTKKSSSSSSGELFATSAPPDEPDDV